MAKPAYSTSSYTTQRQLTAPKVQPVQVTTTPTNYVYSGSTTQNAATSYQPSTTTYQAVTTTPVTTYSSKYMDASSGTQHTYSGTCLLGDIHLDKTAVKGDFKLYFVRKTQQLFFCLFYNSRCLFA